MSLKHHTVWAAAELITNVLVQFFVMKVVITHLGAQALGIWAVLISFAQTARLLDPGVAAGAGRFLARYHFEGNLAGIQRALGAAFYTTVPLFVMLSLISYVPIQNGLHFVFDEKNIIFARSLLPFAFASFLSQTISSIYSSSLTSLNLGSLKSKIVIFFTVIQAFISIMLVDHYGLKGFAFAQIVTNIAIAIISLTILRTVIGVKLWKTFIFEIEAIREMMVFGIGVQLTSLAWALFEMAIRLLMARYGGVQQVGYYEIAYKLSSQARILMGYVGQPVSPVFVRLSVGAKEDLITFYKRIYARYASFAIVSTLSVAIASPLVSYLMLGRIEKLFIVYCITTILGTAAHICAIPSELTAIAFGRIRHNLAGTATGAVTCFMLGSLLGVKFQALGVASGVLIASIVAAVIPIIFNSRMLRLPMAPRPLSDLHLKEML